MARTSFRAKLLLLTIVPLLVAQLVTLAAVMRTVQSDVDRRAHESLTIGAAVVDEYVSSRSEQLRTSVAVLAADFGLKEAVATGYSETIRSALSNHIRRIGADMALLADLDGNPVASTHGLQMDRIDALVGPDDADDRNHYQFTGEIDGAIYQAFAVPLKAPTTIAWVVVGFRIDGAFAERIASLTGLDVAVTDAQHDLLVVNSQLPQRLAAGADLLVPETPSSGEVYLLHDAAEGYLALNTPLVQGDPRVQIVLLRSVADAMAPYAAARRWLIMFSGVLLVLVATAAAWVSSGVARPLGILTNAVREVISGEYAARLSISSNDEFGELASNFNAMRTAIAERERRISHQALHDPLTDLPNRSKIIGDLGDLVDSGAFRHIAVISVRLSRMHEISSTLGYQASDDLIRLAARHLSLNRSPSDGIAHVGTDEFLLVLPGRDVDDAVASAEKVEEILSSGVTLGRVNIALQTECGIAVYPQHGTTAAGLLRNSMISRNEAKARGDSIAIYEPGRDEHFVRQLRIVNDLRSAIQKDQIRVYFQPKLALPSGEICGGEALVRWNHPEYGWLAPDQFIGSAEEAGTIVHLTRHVLVRAMTECRRWQDAGHELHVAVNISAHDLHDEYLPYYILEKLREHDLPPERLTLEVTENSIMRQVQKSITVLQCLRDIGVRISMDDFGTGHSSLAQLKKIPLHQLKIDKSFVMSMLQDEQDESIVRTMLELAHNMKLEVVAEGIEDVATMRYLSQSGCNQAQGYFVSKPLAADEFLSWLGGFKPVSFAERRHEASGLPRNRRVG